MADEELTRRLVRVADYGNRTVHVTSGHTRVNDKSNFVGYVEATKSYPFDKKNSIEAMREYLEDHPAVHYQTWFEDKIEEIK